MKSIALKLILLVFTVLIYVVSVRAVQQMGWDEANVFVTDFAHPWRAQFNTDFSLHVVLIMGWVFWREGHPLGRVLCCLGCLMGGVFTFPYLLVSLWRSQGDVRKLMLGQHA